MVTFTMPPPDFADDLDGGGDFGLGLLHVGLHGLGLLHQVVDIASHERLGSWMLNYLIGRTVSGSKVAPNRSRKPWTAGSVSID